MKASLHKNSISVKSIEFFGNAASNLFGLGRRGNIKYTGLPNQTNFKKGISFDGDVHLISGRGKRTHIQDILTSTKTITSGLAAAAADSVLALTSLTAAAQTVTASITNPDAPRVARIVAAKSGATAIGDGTMAGVLVQIVGTDIHDQAQIETIPLNDTTAVNGKKAFKTITSIILPAKVNTTGDQVSVGCGDVFGLEKSVAATADFDIFEKKASAATAYTVTALGTLDIGYAATTIGAAIDSDDTSITLVSATGWPDSTQRTHAWLESPDGDTEEVVITTRSTTTLTVKRGMNGTTARAWPKGSAIVFRAPMTFAATVTANDRFRLSYKTAEI